MCELGADVHATGMFNATPLFFAAAYGDEETVQLLLDRGAWATKELGHHLASIGRTKSTISVMIFFCQLAIGQESISIALRLILGKGASARAESQESSGRLTPLHMAALADRDVISRTLVAAGEWIPFPFHIERHREKNL